MKDFINKKIGILGLGEENIALVNYLIKHGAENITICDQKNREELKANIDKINNIGKIKIDFHLGSAYMDELRNFEIIFRSPGLPYINEKIQDAKKQGTEISSAIKLFFSLCPSPIIGVTGTKGKGTTASLIFKILSWKSEARNPKPASPAGRSETRYRNVYLAGNIGNSPFEFIDKLTKDDIVILELSSFQLQDMDKSPHIAVVLDIKSDHLDYHKNQDEYIMAKQNVVIHQNKSDFCVINADYLTSFEFAALSAAQTYWFSRKKAIDQGAWVRNNEEIILNFNDNVENIIETKDLQLRGAHNLENICAAIIAAKLCGANIESIKNTLKSFRGLEHRLEFVDEINGVKFYNDSYSTTPDTTIAAVKAFSEPIILIAGGSEKNADYTELGETITNSNVKTAILIGETGPRIKSVISNQLSVIGKSNHLKIIDTCKNMNDIFAAIEQEMKPGDVVLLSPASASFDWFKNYSKRGYQFKNAVLNLKKDLS